MKVRFSSDHHLDTQVLGLRNLGASVLAETLFAHPRHEEDLETVLVLSGDLWVGSKALAFGPDNYSWLGALSARFKAVVVVLGNHDLWGETLTAGYTKFRALCQKFENCYLLESSLGYGSVQIGETRFVGSTLWTNLNQADRTVIWNFDHEKDMNGRSIWGDKRNIRVDPGYKKLGSLDVLARHRLCVKTLKQELEASACKTVLVTHMAPSLKALGESKAPCCDASDYLYASDLEAELLSYDHVVLAIHGHIHQRQSYAVGACRVECNPAGYLLDPVTGFDPSAFVVV